MDLCVVGFFMTDPSLPQWVRAGWAAGHAERVKWSRYAEWCAAAWTHFYAFGIEVYGRLGRQAYNWLHHLATAAAAGEVDPEQSQGRLLSEWCTDLAFTLARENARMIREHTRGGADRRPPPPDTDSDDSSVEEAGVGEESDDDDGRVSGAEGRGSRALPPREEEDDRVLDDAVFRAEIQAAVRAVSAGGEEGARGAGEGAAGLRVRGGRGEPAVDRGADAAVGAHARGTGLGRGERVPGGHLAAEEEAAAARGGARAGAPRLGRSRQHDAAPARAAGSAPVAPPWSAPTGGAWFGPWFPPGSPDSFQPGGASPWVRASGRPPPSSRVSWPVPGVPICGDATTLAWEEQWEAEAAVAGREWNWASPVCAAEHHPDGPATEAAAACLRVGLARRGAGLPQTVAVSRGLWGQAAAAEMEAWRSSDLAAAPVVVDGSDAERAPSSETRPHGMSVCSSSPPSWALNVNVASSSAASAVANAARIVSPPPLPGRRRSRDGRCGLRPPSVAQRSVSRQSRSRGPRRRRRSSSPSHY